VPAAPAGPGGPEGAPVPGPTGSPEVPLLAMPPAPAAGRPRPPRCRRGAPVTAPGATPVHGAPPPPPGATRPGRRPPRAAFFTTATPPAATDAPAPCPHPGCAAHPRTAPDDRPPRRWATGWAPAGERGGHGGGVAVGVGKVVSTYGRPYFHYGDQAVLGLRVIDATTWWASSALLALRLEPPGPALFYLLAPGTGVGGRSPLADRRELLINGACLVMASWWSGGSPASAGPLVVAVIGTRRWRWASTSSNLLEPRLVAPALLLTMVLAAAALSARDRRRCGRRWWGRSPSRPTSARRVAGVLVVTRRRLAGPVRRA